MSRYSLKNTNTIMSPFLLACLLTAMPLSARETPEMLFRTARYAETVKGELHEALRLYQRVLAMPETDEALSVRVLVRMGGCYEKLGDSGAREIYERILREYSGHTEAAAVSQARLAALEAEKDTVHPLVSWYFQRACVDPYASVSHDGKTKAYTDWATGNLVIRDLWTGEITPLTDTDWNRSESYAYHPAWSRDGRFIAYAWYTGFFASELRIADLENRRMQTLWSSSDCLVYPQDFSPDGSLISVETVNPGRNPAKRMGLFSMKDRRMEEPLVLDTNARGFRFSPDGKWIAFDWQETEHRHIYVYAPGTGTLERLTRGGVGHMGFDNPVWSPDGGRILCRSLRSARFDLWEIDTDSRSPGFSPRLVQEDLTNVVIAMKSIDHFSEETKIQQIRQKTPTNIPESFAQNFDSTVLDSTWSVFQWSGGNVYEYPAFGRYSLNERPGHLRYYLDPMMFPRHQLTYFPRFSGWYWYYPSLEIGSLLAGERWELETRVTYHILDGMNDQNLALYISFDPLGEDSGVLSVTRSTNMTPSSILEAVFSRPDEDRIHWKKEFSLPEERLRGKGPFVFRIRRDRRRIQLYFREERFASPDSLVLEGQLPASLQSPVQRVYISGECWFTPAGTYADFDYIRLRPLKADERIDFITSDR